MAYTLERFCEDCRSHLDADPGPAGASGRRDLERLLGEPGFVSAPLRPRRRARVHLLYEDPRLGFQVLAHVNARARKSPPHDHGASWAIYGQATGYTDMIRMGAHRFRRRPRKGAVRPEKTYRLEPGQAGIYADGKIHSIDYPDDARFVRSPGPPSTRSNASPSISTAGR